MNQRVETLISSGRRAHIVCTGAGAGLQKILWETIGVSSFLSGASFPYDSRETNDMVGYELERSASEDAAIELAMAAYMKAHTHGGPPAVGMAMTSVVATREIHRGDHRVHAAFVTDDKIICTNTILEKRKGYEARISDGNLCDRIGLLMLEAACGVRDNAPFDELMESGDTMILDGTLRARSLLMKRPYVLPTGKRLGIDVLTVGEMKNAALFPGSFNPPHVGHFGMADAMTKNGYDRVVFNVTTTSVHKPTLTVQDVLRRMKYLKGRHVLFTENDPLYVHKARFWNNHGVPVIIMGADAALTMLDPKWGVEIDPMLEEFRRHGAQFMIFGRSGIGEKDVVEALPVAWKLRRCDIFHFMSGEWDVSSTEFRKSD